MSSAEEIGPQPATAEPLPKADGVGDAAQKRAEHGTARPKAVHRVPPVNAIAPTRRPRGRREPPVPVSVAEAGAAAPASNTQKDPAARAPAASTDPSADRADIDPWTVPQSVRDRFVQDGHRFFFPDGAPAFKDLGHRLTTASENTQIVANLIEIAHSRGWTEVTVSGTERFRQEAWRQARLAGLAVRGYRPSDPEQTQLIRAMARKLSMPLGERSDANSADLRPVEPRAPVGAPTAAVPPAPAPDRREGPRERLVGRLLDHGRDAYRHDPQEEMSYFVRVQTREGKREIWGKDLERAMTRSLTQPQVGDEVVLQQTGRDAVTVKRQERDAQGELKEKEVETHRNRWVIEKRAFFEDRAAAAQVVRDSRIDARAAVGARPELTGTYLNLKAAELASRTLRDQEDQKRFVAHVRTALADDIERGEPLQPVRLRERVAHLATRAAREAERGPAR